MFIKWGLESRPVESSLLRREVFENNLNDVENNSRVTGVLSVSWWCWPGPDRAWQRWVRSPVLLSPSVREDRTGNSHHPSWLTVQLLLHTSQESLSNHDSSTPSPSPHILHILPGKRVLSSVVWVGILSRHNLLTILWFGNVHYTRCLTFYRKHKFKQKPHSLNILCIYL